MLGKLQEVDGSFRLASVSLLLLLQQRTEHVKPPLAPRIAGLILFQIPLALTAVATADAQAFTKVFLPDAIGPGSVSTLRFDITNLDPVNGLSDMAFTDTLPAGVTIAAPAAATSSCIGSLSAPDGGTTITFSDGELGAGGACVITVNVTAAALGSHVNTTGTLTTSAGTAGTASDTLDVTINRPGFTKSFAPATISLGGGSTLTFTIDNTANPSIIRGVNFTDILPVGIEVADPANAATTCTGATVTAVPGSNVIGLASLASDVVAASASCTVTVDVDGTAVGSLGNVTGELSFIDASLNSLTAGRAGAVLTVTGGRIVLQKAFTDDPALPGGTATLEFTILNRDRSISAAGISFTDDLDAVLSGLVATAPLPTDPCGPGSTISGTSNLVFSGGDLAPGASCTFDVMLQLPASVSGVFTNTTSQVSADFNGTPVNGNVASDDLLVRPVPSLTKSFIDDPVVPGGTVTLRFSITNTSDTASATDIAFTDNLSAVVASLAPSFPLPDITSCGPGATLSTFTTLDDLYLQVQGASLAPAGSCTFDVPLEVPLGAAGGTFLNTTSTISATVGGVAVLGGSASDSLIVVAGPRLRKAFTDDPVVPDGTVTLEFTLYHDSNADGDATAIAFTDDLDAALPGLAPATPGVVPNICGPGSQLDSTVSPLDFSGGSLSPGSSCTFSITLAVPAAALPGSHTNTTSNVVATVAGLQTIGNPGVADLQVMVEGLAFTKEFTDDPVRPGNTVSLEFTIANTSLGTGATNISFTDDLDSVLSGLVALAPLPTDPCGPGSQIFGTSNLIFLGGNLVAGQSCTFSVSAQVPSASVPGVYRNRSSALSATWGGTPVSLPGAQDDLTVSQPLSITKSFTDDPVALGDTVTLEFTLTNADPVASATNLAFTDDLEAALPGLMAIAPLPTDPCGPSSTLTGTEFLTFTGGSLSAGSSCTFSVTLQVPTAVSPGATITNVTSLLTGDVGGAGLSGDPAADDLQIQFFTFTKDFDGVTTGGGTPRLTFTIENSNPTADAIGLSFSDDLDAVIAGLVATGLPATDVCGPGSLFDGTSFLTLVGGNLLPGGSCTFGVDLAVPSSASGGGTFINTTSDLLDNGIPVADPATASLTVEPAPTFSKSFAPNAIQPGGVSTLTFTVDNTASSLSASNLTFTDNLPPSVRILSSFIWIANPQGNPSTCLGGTLTAVGGESVISYSGGAVAAGSSCTIQIDVTSDAEGAHLNTTSELTSSLGSSGTAQDTLTVAPFAPSEPAAVVVSREVRLTWTDNSNFENEFRVERRLPGQPFSLIATVSPDVTSILDRHPPKGVMLQYRVIACSVGGVCSVPSGVVTVTVPPLTFFIGDN
jgi:hypothetical protein